MTEAEKPRRNWLALAPLAAFLALAGVFLVQLMSDRNEHELPSALIGLPAPATDLPPLDPTAGIGLRNADFTGKVTLVNVFASWCVPCRQEHPFLLELAKDQRFRLVGLNYKDKAENASGFLGELGNPYAAIGADVSGRAGIDWGVTGVPETYLVDREGVIRAKFVGPLSPETFKARLEPEIAKALPGS